MNEYKAIICGIILLSIFLIWQAFSQKKKVRAKITPRTQQRQVPVVNTRNHDCVPPRGARIGVVVGTIQSSAKADGQSTLKTLQESLLWSQKNLFEEEAGLRVEEIVNRLHPSITPFVWEYRT